MAESLPSSLMTGSSFLRSSPEQIGREVRLARVHPVDVAAQGVDFAVVRHVTVRMRAFPGRKRVRAEARMHEAQRAGQ
jgi:hypothetical protein